MIEVDTRQYLPLHIAEIDEFKKIAKTYDEFLKLAWASLQKEELNRILATIGVRTVGAVAWYSDKSC